METADQRNIFVRSKLCQKKVDGDENARKLLPAIGAGPESRRPEEQRPIMELIKPRPDEADPAPRSPDQMALQRARARATA